MSEEHIDEPPIEDSSDNENNEDLTKNIPKRVDDRLYEETWHSPEFSTKPSNNHSQIEEYHELNKTYRKSKKTNRLEKAPVDEAKLARIILARQIKEELRRRNNK